ncbi:hypothetical protein N7468_001328 [Penicillium chermesinum]|uniref:OTU domain-containing protein n=1 Tax=Penicillium chermesinum TaxID=63820 RepID=A0A9W9PGL3_9EURO|nr:uncharacterized protein N7468_001328 [Penicillium chermesinum]KAJ5246345.1 hypothetical protein N7468_001328 [Penicillium chermesinum]
MSLDTHGRIVPILKGQHSLNGALDSVESYGRLQHSELEHNIFTPSNSSQLEKLHYASPSALSSSSFSTSSFPQQQAMRQTSLELPSLKEHGLFALPTEGDGNCLYYSLSDQMYGDFGHAQAIRQTLADHMVSHKGFFMQFVAAEGGERRRPKRAAASAYATRSAAVGIPSADDMERRFEEMIASTRKNGERGSSEHLQAFCQAFRVDINVYTMDGVQRFRDFNAGEEKREAIHIAFHDFKHYSTVHPIKSEHEGLLSKPPTNDEKEVITGELIDAKACPVKSEDPITRRDSQDTVPTSISDTSRSTPDTTYTAHDSAVELSPPLDIQHIHDELGGRYDRDTIVDMLQNSARREDRLRKEASPGFDLQIKLARVPIILPYSTGSKRSADDSDDDSESPRPATSRGRPRKRLISNLTMGVGISFRDDHNEVVSLNLRMHSEAAKAKSDKSKAEALEKVKLEPNSEEAEAMKPVKNESDGKLRNASPEAQAVEKMKPAPKKGPRRSGRLSKSRTTTPQ